MPHQDEVVFVDTGGAMPPMWPRRVMFFANLLAIFFGNDEQTAALRAVVGEIDSYSARLIPILNLLFRGDDNLLFLEREPDPTLCRYLHDDLGLSLPRMHVLSHNDYLDLGKQLIRDHDFDPSPLLGRVISHNPGWVDGYVTDDSLARIATRLGCPTVTTTTASFNGNNKLRLHEFLVSQGLPTFDTCLAESGSDIFRCADELSNLGYQSAVIRAQVGASGIGMLRLRELRSPGEFPSVPPYFFHDGPCMVQGWLAPSNQDILEIYSPSTQLFLDENHVYAFDMTEQILSSENVHQGNESPPPYIKQFSGLYEETIRQAAIVTRWLHGTGYRGTASIDWLVVRRNNPDRFDVYVCEINARVTGATYPSLLAKHFHDKGAWLLRNLRLRVPVTTTSLLQMFERPGHLFHPDRRAGILPMNLNFGVDDLVHKGQFVCIGESTADCHRFLSLAERDLPIQWDSDRD